LSDGAGEELGRNGTLSEADTRSDPAVAQPLIVGAALISLAAVLEGGRRDKIAGIAGHAVGEVAAAAGAGILGEADAMRFVAARGRAMADAAARTETGTSAVIRAKEGELLTALEPLGLNPATTNGAG